eukprot:316437-Prymnesium_polylepis.2
MSITATSYNCTTYVAGTGLGDGRAVSCLRALFILRVVTNHDWDTARRNRVKEAPCSGRISPKDETKDRVTQFAGVIAHAADALAVASSVAGQAD